jgi:hypothetical protein
MPLASAASSVHRMPSATIVSRFGVLPDIMPVASLDCVHGNPSAGAHGAVVPPPTEPTDRDQLLATVA